MTTAASGRCRVDTNQLEDRAALAFAKALEGSKPEQKSSVGLLVVGTRQGGAPSIAV